MTIYDKVYNVRYVPCHEYLERPVYQIIRRSGLTTSEHGCFPGLSASLATEIYFEI